MSHDVGHWTNKEKAVQSQLCVLLSNIHRPFERTIQAASVTLVGKIPRLLCYKLCEILSVTNSYLFGPSGKGCKLMNLFFFMKNTVPICHSDAHVYLQSVAVRFSFKIHVNSHVQIKCEQGPTMSFCIKDAVSLGPLLIVFSVLCSTGVSNLEKIPLKIFIKNEAQRLLQTLYFV